MQGDSTPALGRRLEVGTLLGLVAAAIALRVVLPWRWVIGSGRVWLPGTDPWYHLRLAEAWIQSFPHRLHFDPAVHSPRGASVTVAPLLDLLMALPGALLPLSPHASRVWMALLPALLGGVGVVLTWAWSRALFGPRVGLFAAALLTVDPGGYLHRSLLGVADHHILEAVLTVAVLWSSTHAFRALGEEPAAVARLWRSSVAAGLFLALYLFTWRSGAFFVAVLALYGFAQETLARRDAQRPALPLAVTFATAFVLVATGFGGESRHSMKLTALGLSAGAMVVALLVRRHARRRCWGPAHARLALLGGWGTLTTLAWIALRRAAPRLASDILGQARRLLGGAYGSTVAEARPLLLHGDDLSWRPAWLLHRAALAVGVAVLGYLLLRWRRERDPAIGLLVVWSTCMLITTLFLVRFDHYLSIALAVTTAIAVEGIGRLATRAVEGGGARTRLMYRGLAWLSVATLFVFPALLASVDQARRNRTPATGWRQAMDWLRERTPAAFEDPAWLESPVERLRAEGGAAARPRARYAVISWWDFGYLILTAGRRVPYATPTQRGARTAARLFLEGDESELLAELERLGAGYVVSDLRFAPVPRAGGRGATLGYFDAMVRLAGHRRSDYLMVAKTPDGGRVVVYTEAYYRTLASRLTWLGTGPVRPRGPVGIVAPQTSSEEPRELVARFFRPEEARSALERGNVRGEMVGLAPQASPWGLAPLRELKLVAQFGRLAVRVHQVGATIGEGDRSNAGGLVAERSRDVDGSRPKR